MASVHRLSVPGGGPSDNRRLIDVAVDDLRTMVADEVRKAIGDRATEVEHNVPTKDEGRSDRR